MARYRTMEDTCAHEPVPSGLWMICPDCGVWVEGRWVDEELTHDQLIDAKQEGYQWAWTLIEDRIPSIAFQTGLEKIRLDIIAHDADQF